MRDDDHTNSRGHAMTGRPSTLPELFAAQADSTPDATALITDDGTELT